MADVANRGRTNPISVNRGPRANPTILLAQRTDIVSPHMNVPRITEARVQR